MPPTEATISQPEGTQPSQPLSQPSQPNLSSADLMATERRLNDLVYQLQTEKDKIEKIYKDTEALQRETRTLQDQMKEQKTYLILGFIFLLVMVAAMIISATSDKVTADNEVIHNVDLLESQLTNLNTSNAKQPLAPTGTK